MKHRIDRDVGSAGYAMAALLVGMTITAIFMTVALPAWRTMMQREKEDELIFRGQQYARAIVLFQRKYANTFPPNVDILLNEHFLRKKYKDPMTADGEFQVVYANQQAAAQPGPAQPGGGRQGAGGTVPQQGQGGRGTTQVGPGTTVGPQGGIIGVASKSVATSLRVYNGRSKYNEWVFVAQQATNRPGVPNGTQDPTGALPGRGGAGGAAGGVGGGRAGRGGQPPGRGNQPTPRGQGPNQPAPTSPFGNGGFGRGR